MVKIEVWNWDPKEAKFPSNQCQATGEHWVGARRLLNKDHEAFFDEEVNNVSGFADIDNPWKIVVVFYDCFVIYDILEQEKLREFPVGDNSVLFALPNGELGMLFNIFENDRIMNLSKFLAENKGHDITVGDVDKYKIAQLPGSGSDLLIMPDKEGFVILSGATGTTFDHTLRLTTHGETREIKLGEEFKDFYPSCFCLFGNDVMLIEILPEEDLKDRLASTEKERKAVIFDPVKQEVKERFTFQGLDRLSVTHIRGNKYFLNVKEGVQLLVYSNGKYTLGAKSRLEGFLPTSSGQKKAMVSCLRKLFVEEPIPKDLVGVVSNFI